MTGGRPFEKGNKFGRGRPRGSRNKRSTNAQQFLQEQGESIVLEAVTLARQGDAQLVRALLPYILRRPDGPPLKTPPLRMGTAEEIANTLQDVLKQVAAGAMQLRDAQVLADLLEERRLALETHDLEKRLQALERLIHPSDDPTQTMNAAPKTYV